MEASSGGVCAEASLCTESCRLHRSCLQGKAQLASLHHISLAPGAWLFLPRDAHSTGGMSAQVGMDFWCGYEQGCMQARKTLGYVIKALGYDQNGLGESGARQVSFVVSRNPS